MTHARIRTGLCFVVFLVAGCTVTPSSSTSSESLSISSSSIPISSNITTSTSSESVASSSSFTPISSEEPSEISSIPNDYPFTPGHQGSIPVNTSFIETPGQFAGLYIHQLDRQPLIFSQGTTSEAWLRFPEPFEIGATHFRLQTYESSTSSWVNFGEGDEYVTDYYNFIVPAINDQRLRLLAIGGPRDGDVSNEVQTFFTTAETYFSGYSLDESMALTGIMSPFVGSGYEASFSVMSYVTNEPVTTGLTYQWYRVNPYTFEHIVVPGATSLTYATTIDDLGYYMAIVATGDGINVAGRYEVISQGDPVTLPVKTFATDGTSTSFRLHFEYAIPSINIPGFYLQDDSYNQLMIASAVLDNDHSSATITLTEPTTAKTLYLSGFDLYWAYVNAGMGMPMVEITIP